MTTEYIEEKYSRRFGDENLINQPVIITEITSDRFMGEIERVLPKTHKDVFIYIGVANASKNSIKFKVYAGKSFDSKKKLFEIDRNESYLENVKEEIPEFLTDNGTIDMEMLNEIITRKRKPKPELLSTYEHTYRIFYIVTHQFTDEEVEIDPLFHTLMFRAFSRLTEKSITKMKYGNPSFLHAQRTLKPGFFTKIARKFVREYVKKDNTILLLRGDLFYLALAKFDNLSEEDIESIKKKEKPIKIKNKDLKKLLLDSFNNSVDNDPIILSKRYKNTFELGRDLVRSGVILKIDFRQQITAAIKERLITDKSVELEPDFKEWAVPQFLTEADYKKYLSKKITEKEHKTANQSIRGRIQRTEEGEKKAVKTKRKKEEKTSTFEEDFPSVHNIGKKKKD